MNTKVYLETERFILRSLTTKDATLQYVGWLNEQSSSGFIHTAKKTNTLNQVHQYILERVDRHDVIFLGIFTREQNQHIGNLKFEPISQVSKYAVMGVMIGDPLWRGKGVAAEVISSSAKWLHKEIGLNEIVLGVDLRNYAAIRAYEKAGFRVQKTDKVSVDGTSTVSMVLCLEDLG